MAKDTNDKATIEAFPQQYVCTYTYIHNGSLKRGQAVYKEPTGNKESARIAFLVDLTHKFGEGNFKINKVELW